MSLIKNPFFRYTLIDELLGRKKWVKTTEIKRIIEEKLGEPVSVRTIQNDICDLKDDTRLRYNAPIEYDHTKKAYRYTDPNYSIKNFGLNHNEVTAFKFYTQCLSMFSGYSLFNDFTTGLNKIIQGIDIRSRVTNTNHPLKIIQTDTLIAEKGNEFLGDAVYAIDNQYKIELKYHGFDKKIPTKRLVYPYFIKEYKHRWYLLAVPKDEWKIKTFAFDRIKSLNLIEEKFTKDIDFDADEYFKYSFGITTPNEKVEEVILRFDKSEAPYIKTLAVHPTQQILRESRTSLEICIHVRVSYELKEYILSKTPFLKVVRPKTLASEISELIALGQKKYFKTATSRK
jgi:predicted DNA-binding transcriptional regulator YafY